MTTNACENCAFALGTHVFEGDPQQYECRRYPPFVSINKSNQRHFSEGSEKFPIVKRDWFCGEFKPVEAL